MSPRYLAKTTNYCQGMNDKDELTEEMEEDAETDSEVEQSGVSNTGQRGLSVAVKGVHKWTV